MPRDIFITGTDTEIGKTHVTCAVLGALTRAGRTALAMKPVAAGATRVDGELWNEDVARLAAASTNSPEPGDLNQFILQRAAAPTFGAADEGVEICCEPIVAAYARQRARADHVLVEGVGGWMVPLSDTIDLAGLVRSLSVPVVLVVGLRLGCINHARLTARAIEADGLPLLGWVSNHVDINYPDVPETLETLHRYLDAPCLGHVAHQRLISTGAGLPATDLGALMEALLN